MSESSEKQCVSFVCGLSILKTDKNVKYFYSKISKIYTLNLKNITSPSFTT